MENNDRRRAQSNSTLGYAGGQQGTLQSHSHSQYPVVSASDRFRQAHSTAGQPPTSAPAPASRASSQSYGYAYAEGSQFVNPAIQPSSYGAAAAAQDYAPPEQRASQHYGQYGQNVMYSVPGQQAVPTTQTQYETVPQYAQQRDSSAIEVLSTGFGVAQPQYYVPAGEGGPTSAPSVQAAVAQSVPSYSSLGYTTAQQGPAGRDNIAPAYTSSAAAAAAAAGMPDPHQAPTSGTFTNTQASYGDQSGNEYDDFYNNYQTELKKTFEHTRDGRLSEAAANLFRLSDWLLHWAETLGLVRDDENHYTQRLKLWEEFNNCWLITLQRQLDTMQEMISTGQRPQPPQTLIDRDYLEKMGSQLVKNCDNIEKHGLVDYQMGVWEEEILAMLTNCIDIWDQVGGGGSSSSSSAQRAIPSAASSRRR